MTILRSTLAVLWTIHKDTKNESNSQHDTPNLQFNLHCELYTKIQKMKAIHNGTHFPLNYLDTVNYTQRYKKWKQFTTTWETYQADEVLWTIHKDTKNESNSQLINMVDLFRSNCELYTKIQKMKAIHNRRNGGIGFPSAVNYTQRYKKWKQFTTYFNLAITCNGCELYTKIQELD